MIWRTVDLTIGFGRDLGITIYRFHWFTNKIWSKDNFTYAQQKGLQGCHLDIGFITLCSQLDNLDQIRYFKFLVFLKIKLESLENILMISFEPWLTLRAVLRILNIFV